MGYGIIEYLQQFTNWTMHMPSKGNTWPINVTKTA